jgi:hypothetical protein
MMLSLQYGPQIHELSEDKRARAHFFSYGIGSKDEEIDGVNFYTLETLMRMNGHDWIDIRRSRPLQGMQYTHLDLIL